MTTLAATSRCSNSACTSPTGPRRSAGRTKFRSTTWCSICCTSTASTPPRCPTRSGAGCCSISSSRDRRGRCPPTRSATGAALLDAATERHLEGLMAKRIDSRYEPGRRSPAWRKVKIRGEQEFVVGGWSTGQGQPIRRVRVAGPRLPPRRRPDRPARLCRKRRHRLQRDAELGRLQAQLDELATDVCPFRAGAAAFDRARRRDGSAQSSWPRSRSPNGRPRDGCDIRPISACGGQIARRSRQARQVEWSHSSDRRGRECL